jgi:hypothetical protein
MLSPEESSLVVQNRPGTASSVPNSPNLNVYPPKPMTPRCVNGNFTPTFVTAGLPVSFVTASSDFTSSMPRQSPATTTQGFTTPGSPYGVPASPVWESRADLGGAGPIRRRRTNSNTSTSSKNAAPSVSSQKSGNMSPPAPPRPLTSTSGESTSFGDSSRWFVELAETATWYVVARANCR